MSQIQSTLDPKNAKNWFERIPKFIGQVLVINRYIGFRKTKMTKLLLFFIQKHGI